MPAIPYSDTAVTDGAWDGPGNEAKLSNDAGAATYRKMYAWVDPNANADTKAAYKFPHHFVSDGTPGAASVSGVRAGLARAAQSGTNIPDADRSAVKSHLQKHLDKFNASNKSSDDDLETLSMVSVLDTKGRVLVLTENLVADLANLHGRHIAMQTLAALETSARVSTRKPSGDESVVRVIPLQGVLRPTPSILAMLFGGGGGGLLAFREQMLEAGADPKVSAIVMDVNSPGGFVDMIPEVAADIRSVREAKPVVAVANTVAGSAAYWLASQASQVVVSPSGEVGSIGVYQIHENISGALAKQGVDVTIVKAGKYKVEGHSFGPLDEEAATAMQADVNAYYDMFTSDVALGRGVAQSDVQSGYGEGRMVLANRAVKMGLADKVEQLGTTVKRLTHPGARAALQRADAEALEANPPEALLPPSVPSEKAMELARERFAAQNRLTAEERDRVLTALAG
jgi:signal peptide peptidase SppA